jgi:hypothetical protein
VKWRGIVQIYRQVLRLEIRREVYLVRNCWVKTLLPILIGSLWLQLRCSNIGRRKGPQPLLVQVIILRVKRRWDILWSSKKTATGPLSRHPPQPPHTCTVEELGRLSQESSRKARKCRRAGS